MLVRIANREDPYQTASLQSDMGLHCLFRHFWQANIVQNFRKHVFIVLLKFSMSCLHLIKNRLIL